MLRLRDPISGACASSTPTLLRTMPVCRGNRPDSRLACPGAVSAVAVPGDPDSAGSQFFIAVTDQPSLDGLRAGFSASAAGAMAMQRIPSRSSARSRQSKASPPCPDRAHGTSFFAAAIGYVTKVVAIHMMFAPLEFVGIKPFLGWQGIVPRKAEKMAGIGGDGVIRVIRTAAMPVPHRERAAEAEWFMDYRNSDGSVSEMCGNGIRLFARHLVDSGLADGSAPIPVGTRPPSVCYDLSRDGRYLFAKFGGGRNVVVDLTTDLSAVPL